jgi:hypothetical protein
MTSPVRPAPARTGPSDDVVDEAWVLGGVITLRAPIGPHP